MIIALLNYWDLLVTTGYEQRKIHIIYSVFINLFKLPLV